MEVCKSLNCSQMKRRSLSSVQIILIPVSAPVLVPYQITFSWMLRTWLFSPTLTARLWNILYRQSCSVTLPPFKEYWQNMTNAEFKWHWNYHSCFYFLAVGLLWWLFNRYKKLINRLQIVQNVAVRLQTLAAR